MKLDYHDKPLKIFMAYVFAHKGLFAVDMLCALAVAAIDLIFPWVRSEEHTSELQSRE